MCIRDRPNVLNISLEEAFQQEPGFNEAAKKDPRIDDVLKVAVRLEGLSRNCSVHAAGVVISPQPLKDLIPLYKTNRDEIVTQFDMNGLDKLALLKMDFLGLTTLTLIPVSYTHLFSAWKATPPWRNRLASGEVRNSYG